MQKKLLPVIAIIVSVVAIGFSAFSFIFTVKNTGKTEAPVPAASEEIKTPDIQYVLFLGTNDKDSNQPVFDKETSIEKAKEILTDHFGGYTIQDANGGWVGDDGTLYQEYTLVIYLSDTDIDAVHSACDDLVKTFNQSAILIQGNETKTEFYSGK